MSNSSVESIFLQNAGGTNQPTGMFSSGMPGYMPAYLTWLDPAGLPQEFVCFVKSEDYDFGADVTEHPVETGSNITDNVRVKLREAKIFFFETNAPIDSNNWATLLPQMSILVVPSAPPSPPQFPLEFNAWDNLITEKALGASALGAIGNLGGAGGGAVGTILGEAVGSALVGAGIPVPIVVPPPSPTLGGAPLTQYQSQALGLVQTKGTGPDFVAATINLLQQLLTEVQVVTLNAPKLTITSMVINSIHVHRDGETGDAAEIEVGLKEIRFVSTTSVPAPAPTVIRTTPEVNKGEKGSSDAGAQTSSVARTALLALYRLLTGTTQ